MTAHVPELSARGLGITQVVDGVRRLLVAPDETGAPGQLTPWGFFQARAGWTPAIVSLRNVWAQRAASGAQEVARIRQRELDLRMLTEAADELVKTGARPVVAEIVARGGGYEAVADAATAAALERVEKWRQDAGDVLVAPVDALRSALDTAGTVAKAAAWGLGIYGLAKIIGATRGR